jgi:membrane-associated protease RseP (regulator of RpoE activity)
MAFENLATTVIALFALGILAVGYNRARPYGKLGILAWLQSVSLMLPWLAFFVLFTLGIYINLVGILLLLGVSTGLYIFLGSRLRTLAKDSPLLRRPNPNLADAADSLTDADAASATNADANADAAESAADLSPPLSLVPEVTPIPAEDLQAIQGVFGIDTFFITETIPYQEGAIFKGNLRGDPAVVHERLTAAVHERLGDRYRLFLVENADGRPTIVVLPSSDDPKPATTGQWVLAAGLAIATVITSLAAGGLLLGFDLFEAWDRWAEALPLATGLLIILGSHEIAHQIQARRYGVKLSVPFFLPVLQIGSFGALNRFESLLPNRQVLCDIAIAGPIAGGVVSLLMLLTGLGLSHPGSAFQLPTEFFQGSILVGTLARLVLGSALQQPVVDIDPLVAIGWLGMTITAINLLPAGQLDGGRIVQAIYGRKIARRSTVATLIVLGIASLTTPLALYWAIAILFLQRQLERPSLEELTEPDDARAALGLLVLFLTVATLLPLTPSLAGKLGIGG